MKKNYLTERNLTTSPDASIKTKILFKNATLLLLIFLDFTNVFGQTSSSDCTNTTVGAELTIGTSCTMVNFNSTNNTDYWNSASGCNSGDDDDAWGWFTATSTSTTINYYSANDAVLHLFTGSCATNMTALACSDTFNAGGTETITWATTVGVKYIIRIQRWNSSANMNGTICVYSPVPPPTITNLLTATDGCVGSSITITGTNLTGATAANIRIGGTAVSSITSNNGTTLVAVIGAGTTGTVSITTGGGTATSVGTFTVNPLPAAIGGASTVCTGDSTTLTDATVGGTWSIANGTGSATISGTGDVAGITAGTVTVTYTLPTGCLIIKTITIQQTPGAIAGGAATVCEGAATPAFTNPNSGGTWSVVNGTGTATITAGGVLTGTAAGTVTVNYTIGLCTPATYIVTINPTPLAIVGAIVVCTGDSITLTNTTTGGTWSIANGTGSATISVTGDVNGVSAGSVTVTYTLPTTCNVTKIITVQDPPGAIVGGAAAVCVSSSTPAFTNPNPGGTWSVVNGTGTATITTGGVLTGTASGTVTVYYTIGTCPAASYAVTVNPTPAAIVGAATVCTGATTTLTNATSGGTWTIANGTGSATISATGDVSGLTAGNVIVSYTLLPNCSVTKSLTIQQTPGAIAGGAATVCVGAATPAFTNPNAGGAWSVVNGTGTATITAGGVLSGSAAGSVTVNYTIGLCTPATFAVTVNPTPAAIAGAATLCTGASITLTDASPGGTWTIANGTGSATISATGDVSGVSAGNVTVSYTLLPNCSVTKSLTIQQTPGAIAGGAATVCVGAATPAFTNPNGGGTWSVVSGGGTATITGGGVLSGTAAGTVIVNYTIGLCTPATYIVTINALPANPSNPTSNSPQCNPAGVILTRAFPPLVTEYLCWQTAILGTDTSNKTNTLTVTTSGTYYIRAQNISSGCWSAGSGNLTVVVNNTISTLATVPNPTNGATGVCYIGLSPVNSISWTAAAGATSYDVYFGAGSLPGSVTSNVATTSYTTGALLASTTYYWKIVPKNICGATTGTPTTWTFTTSSAPCYCTPTVSNNRYQNNYIKQVSFVGNLTNPPANNSTWSTSPQGYQDFTSLTKATQAQGEGVNIFIDTQVTGFSANYMKVWVDWNRNGIFENGEIVYQCTNPFINTTFGFQIPVATLPGDYRIRMRILSSSAANNTFDACTLYNNVDGETEDYLFSIVSNCSAKITSITNGFNCGTGAVTLNAVGSSGTTEYRWYTTATGGIYTVSPTSSWDTPSISATTTYYVTAYNGLCESLYRTAVIATIKKVPSLTFSNSDPEICGENNVIDLTAAGSNEQIFLVDENFEGATISFTNNQIASPNGAITNWKVRSSTYVPAYPTYPVWYPAISSGFGTNKFIMSTSDLTTGGTTAGKVNEALELTTAVNTAGFINLTMTFKIYFSSYYDSNNANTEGVFIQIDSGSGWVTTPIASYLGDEGIGTNFVTKTISMNAYINITSLKVRIRYRAGWCDGVAIDDIKLFGDKPLLPNFTWTSGFPINAYTNFLCTPIYAYTAGTPVSTVYVKPSLPQLENGTFAFTANANLVNGCTTSGTITVTNKSKVWKGINGSWNDANNWLPVGVPDATNCVIISTAPNNCSVGITNFNGYGKTLQVIDDGSLTINSSNSLTITDFVEVRGTTSAFIIEDSGSLLQINDAVVNKGDITFKRIAPSIKGSDYVYWSSPVENQNMGTIYDPTFPFTSGYKYQWNTTLNNGNGTGGNIGQGLWEVASGIMTRARGYIIRGSSSFGMPASNIPTIFKGVPFNGLIPYTVQRGTYTGPPYNGANTIQITNLNDNYNLLGNPYPSSINALKFLRLNAYDPSTNPSGRILGNVKLWTHGTDPRIGVPNPFYGSFLYNYDVNDYLTINYLGATVPGALDIIKSGQAFFVQMIDIPFTGPSIVNFNNSMRFDDLNLPYSNSGFYKNGTTTNNQISSERHRIWLDIVDASNLSSGTLVGYATDATNGYDNLFDAPTGVPSGLKVFSMIENNLEVYEIQGRTLPFDINDEIAIGIVAPTQGNYTFALAEVDGLFDTQNIYLRDNLLNISHNLKTNPYPFTTAAGVHKDRFTIVYVDSTLGNPDYSIDNTIKVVTNTEVTVSSNTFPMESIVVYNILGQKLNTYKNINSNYVILSNLNKNNITLLLKIKLQTGEIITKKINF